MGYLIENLWLCMLLAALLGLIVGWWMWHSDGEGDEDAYAETAAAPVIPPAPPEPEPAAAAEPEAPVDATGASPFMAAPVGDPDDLTRIKGVGPKLNELLNGLGVYHFSQIAGWNSDQVAEVDSRLVRFKGRITRDRWVDQAHYLATDDIEGFEAEFGNISNQT